ncbi:MAG: TonB-dependent receptor [Planctomycetales bacterium]|nr:TonB-dependent receptor [Planctomycetales bacterium]
MFNPAIAPGPHDYVYTLMTARSTKQKQFTQEFQLQVAETKYDLTAGAFYFHENSPATNILGIFQPVVNGVAIVDPTLDFIFGSGPSSDRSINDSIAGYVQGTYHITDQWDFTAGARYTEDKRKSEIYSVAAAQGSIIGIGTYKVKFDKTNYNVVLAYKPNRNITAYGKVSTGYVAGGLLSGIPYNPEELTSYEIGVKSQLFDNRLRANAAVFYSDYKDLQIQNFINGVQTFENAGKANLTGFELEVMALPMQGLTLEGSVGYTDTSYDEFLTTDPRTGLKGDVADIADTSLQSKWTLRLGAQYDAPKFENGSFVTGRIDANWRSKYPLTTLPIYNAGGASLATLDSTGRMRDAYWLVSGRVGLANIPAGSGTASLSLYGDNIFDEDYVAFGPPVLALQGTYGRGATYGVEFGFQF